MMPVISTSVPEQGQIVTFRQQVETHVEQLRETQEFLRLSPQNILRDFFDTGATRMIPEKQ